MGLQQVGRQRRDSPHRARFEPRLRWHPSARSGYSQKAHERHRSFGNRGLSAIPLAAQRLLLRSSRAYRRRLLLAVCQESHCPPWIVGRTESHGTTLSEMQGFCATTEHDGDQRTELARRPGRSACRALPVLVSVQSDRSNGLLLLAVVGQRLARREHSMKRVILITLGSAALLLGGMFGNVFFGPMLDAKKTWALAADMFEGVTKHRGIPSAEFMSPSEPDVSHGLQYVVLSWTHRSRVC